MANTNEPIPVRTPGGITVLAGSFTRPADTTPYAINDLVGPTTNAADASLATEILNAVSVDGDAFRIERVRLRKSSISLTNASFRIHIWRALPSFTGIGDNGAQGALTALVCASMDHYVDKIDVTMDRASSTAGGYAVGIGAPDQGSAIVVRPSAGTSFWFSIQALAAYTPASAELFSCAFEGMRA